MRPRQIAIVVGVVLAAFAVTFGIAQAGGEEAAKTPATAQPRPAEVIEVGELTVSDGVAAAVDLPALRVPAKKEKEVAPVEPSEGGSPTPVPTAAPTTQATATPPPATTPPPTEDGGEDVITGED